MKAFDEFVNEDLESQKIKFCVDLSDTFPKTLFAAYNSYNERSENLINESASIKPDGALEQQMLDVKRGKDFGKLLLLTEESQQILLELALYRGKLWAKGRTLKVKFLNGSAYLKCKVEKYAKNWEQYADIHFDFISSGDTEIRIAFNPGGSWSYIGTDNLNITDQTEPTMNFGWFDYATREDEFSTVILHEFGHCLGCVHEHQSPAAGLDWDKPVVYDTYQKNQGWDQAMVDKNVLAKYNCSEITNSTYDADSIMHYDFPAQFFNNRVAVTRNANLSSQDIAYIQRTYGKP